MQQVFEHFLAEATCASCGSASFASRGLILHGGPVEQPPAPPICQPHRFAEPIEHRLQCMSCLHEFTAAEQF